MRASCRRLRGRPQRLLDLRRATRDCGWHRQPHLRGGGPVGTTHLQVTISHPSLAVVGINGTSYDVTVFDAAGQNLGTTTENLFDGAGTASLLVDLRSFANPPVTYGAFPACRFVMIGNYAASDPDTLDSDSVSGGRRPSRWRGWWRRRKEVGHPYLSEGPPQGGPSSCPDGRCPRGYHGRPCPDPSAVPRPVPGGRWLLGVPVLVAVGLLALSVIPRWIVHHRELTGEGYRTVLTELSAWHGPLLPAAIGVGLAVSVGRSRPGGWPAIGGCPSARCRRRTGRARSPGCVRMAGRVRPQRGEPVTDAGLGGVARDRARRGGRPRRRPHGPLAPGEARHRDWAGRAAGRRHGRRPHAEPAARDGHGGAHQEGSYSRVATDGAPAEDADDQDGRYTIGSRWSGTFIVAGPLVSLVDDPACPDVRGTYHLYAAGGQDVHFVKVIDTCQDGARARVLETGTWARD